MLLQLPGALAGDDLHQRRLRPDRLIDDVPQRPVDVLAPVVDVVQVQLELHRASPVRRCHHATRTAGMAWSRTGDQGLISEPQARNSVILQSATAALAGRRARCPAQCRQSTPRSHQMRVARAVAAVSSSALLTGLVTGAAAAAPVGVQAVAHAAPAVLIQPDIVHLHGALQGPPSTAFCEKNFKIACYTARQIQQAFNLGPLYAHGTTGKGETIVIVDSYGSPTVARDLAVFDKGSHLPAPPKLTIIQPRARSRGTRRTTTARAGPARPIWTSSTRTPSLRARKSCWWRRLPRRTRAARASPRSSRPRSTWSAITSAASSARASARPRRASPTRAGCCDCAAPIPMPRSTA